MNNSLYNGTNFNTSIFSSNQSNPNFQGISSAKVITEMTIHSVIFLFGTIGNLLVAIVILRNKSTCTTNWLIFNLAVSDLGITLYNIPLSNIYHFTEWPFGRNLCRYFLGGFGESIVGVSVFTHASLAVVRYHVVLNPLRCVIKLKYVQIGIAAIWVLAYASLSAPLTNIFDLVYSPVVKGYVCKPSWPSFEYRISYRSSVLILTYVIPMLLALICYIKIYKALQSSVNFFRKGNTSNAIQLKRREYRSKRLTKALFIIYTFFTITTLPLEIFYLLTDLGLLPPGPYLAHAWSLLVALFYGLSVVNPVMLFYISEEYRNNLCHMFCQCSSRQDKNPRAIVMARKKHRKSETSNAQQYTISTTKGDCGKESRPLVKNVVVEAAEMFTIKKDIFEKEGNNDSAF